MAAFLYDPQNPGTTASLNSRTKRYGLSPRQQDLNALWAVYRCQQYDVRKIDWDGRPHIDPLDMEVAASGGLVPDGFQAVSSDYPLKLRRPNSPYALIPVIINRFTDLLFAEHRNPQIRVKGDPDAEDWIKAFVEETRLWAWMVLARTYGGAMGSVAIGFKIVDGVPAIEVHDPRWCFPMFKNGSDELESMEKRYIYPKDVQDPETGVWRTEAWWYRRVIDEHSDILYKTMPVEDKNQKDDEDPRWQIDIQVNHDFGFCPLVWIQNFVVQDSIDGDTDCPAFVYEQALAIDTLQSQAHRGTVANCDPTLHVADDGEMDDIQKGSDNAIKTSANGKVGYVEIDGSGPKAAVDLSNDTREKALEVSQCVLDNPGTDRATATEIERNYSSMLSKAGKLREQYGVRGVLRLLTYVVRAAQKLAAPLVNKETNRVETRVVLLPDRVETDLAGKTTRTKRRLSDQPVTVSLVWPPYFEASLSDSKQAADTIVELRSVKLIDRKSALEFLAPYLKIQDPAEVMRLLDEEVEQAAQKAEEDMQNQIDLAAAQAAARARPAPGQPKPGAQPAPVKAAS